ncbi:hypothetical protein QAD02_024065 [Eretmocerus hayati]|uniref:Uncharacterized protein n=1 Tax=Eretmocerus hayati TaxID=131215 RepID=A0ACC2PXD8_9HYME|nr:hypothetical protein QAD02_024065 [Eretmocerus hayati]
MQGFSKSGAAFWSKAKARSDILIGKSWCQIVFCIPQQGDKKKPRVVPMSCYVSGEDDRAVIRFPLKLNPAVKKDVEAYQRVLLCGEAVPHDWPEYQAHIFHMAVTIEEAFKVANQLETTAIVSSNNLFDVPNESGTELQARFQAVVDEAIATSSSLATNAPSTSTDGNSGQYVIHNAPMTYGFAPSPTVVLGESSTNILDASGSQYDFQTSTPTSGIGPQADVNHMLLKENLKEMVIGVSQQLNDVTKKVNENGVKGTDVAEQVHNLLEVLNNRDNLAVSLLNIEDINAAFECTFPLDTTLEFLAFQTKLDESDEKKKILLEFISNRLSKKKTINQTMAAILKKFMGTNLLKECSATKKSGTKIILCEAQFYKILEGPMRALYKDKEGKLLDAHSVQVAVGGAINNSSAWTNGSRSVKRKSQPNEHDENDIES